MSLLVSNLSSENTDSSTLETTKERSSKEKIENHSIFKKQKVYITHVPLFMPKKLKLGKNLHIRL